jgi:hypothetical protein
MVHEAMPLDECLKAEDTPITATVWRLEGYKLWQNPLKNKGSVFQDPDWVILDEARMHVNTHTKHLKS